ncbi:hypothetical protein WJX74_002090 [Apatococcus lobatus]|uniref:F-box domain-containing protein n=1 Tax=Apatococcus lobatus TaxID=904363 RepID=A0AAW1RAH6_9CHLO
MRTTHKGRLERLPPELWARVLNHLPIADVLNTRLVCRQMAPLTNHLRLSLVLKKNLSDTEVVSDLQLFISRNCMQTTSPQVFLTAHMFPGLHWCFVMLASMCANLMVFDCESMRFSLHEAQTCLRVLPAVVKCIRIAAPIAIADDAAWGRLASLSALSLWHLDPSMSCAAYTGSGLALLAGLRELSIKTAASPHHGAPYYDGQAFSQRSVVSLHIVGRDPFSGGLNMTRCPALATIYVGEAVPVPAWVEGQQFEALSLGTYEQLSTVNPKRLLVHWLQFGTSSIDQGLKVADLLLMPHLCTVHSEVTALNLDGSFQEHQALLGKLRLTIKGLVQLRMSHPPLRESYLSLRSNGHTIICTCDCCRSSR